MANGPSRGVETKINGLSVKMGALNDGELKVLILAIEKSPGSGDYRWAKQTSLERIEISRQSGMKNPVRNFLEEFMKEANEDLKALFGDIPEDSKDDLDLLNAMIEREVIFNGHKVEYK